MTQALLLRLNQSFTDIAAGARALSFSFDHRPEGVWNMRFGKFSIDEKKPVHVCWWAEQFDVSEEELLEAIAAVGNQANAVQIYLEERKLRQAPV
jgi:hypothetical protein